MAALLVALAVMAILMSVAMPTWRQAAQREREEELIFRGKQYARSVELFQRKFANAFPPSFDVLVDQRFLRRKYKDPMVEDGEFQPLYQLDVPQAGGRQGGGSGGRAGAQGRGEQPSTATGPGSPVGVQAGRFGGSGPRGGIVGVVSKSKDRSIRLYNGRNYYNEWEFVYVPLTVGAGGFPGGAYRPGQREGAGGADVGGRGAMGGRGQGGRGGQRGMEPGGPGPAGPPRGAGRGPG